ncbi:MAG: SpoIIE family protein phosphatase [Spirochaetales bacterium]|nr:SpoIIE family protein phosphatase [Spirochaetales bacterium]
MSKGRIVVVEDEGIVAIQIQEGLVTAGYDVPGIAASGNEALKLISDTEPDLVLMDIHLKGSMDGIQAAMKIREMYDIPVIYLTAYSDHATVERAKETEPYGYLLKPVSERSLELAIEMTLQKAKKEKQLKNDASWYSTILKGIGQGIVVINLKGTVKFINPFAEKITGLTYKTAVDKKYKDIFTLLDPGSKGPLEIPFDEIILENKIIMEDTCLLQSIDNRTISIVYSLIPLQNQNKTTIGIIILFTPHEEEMNSIKPAEVVHKKKSSQQQEICVKSGELIQGIEVQWYRKPGSCSIEPCFNVLALSEEYIGFYIFDASYYGVTSSLFAHNLNQFLLPESEQGGLLTHGTSGGDINIVSPLQVITELNRRFFFEEKDNPFFTIIYGIIHTKSGKTTMVRAGHPYPILQKEEGEIILVKSEGGAVGMFSEIQIHEYEFIFERGARLYLYSDGLIDSSFADMNQASFMRLISFLEENADTPLHQLITDFEEVEKEWHSEIQCSQEISIVALQRQWEVNKK